jgi:hypothetical protein
MPTNNLKPSSNQELRIFSKNPAVMGNCLSKNYITLKKSKQLSELTSEEQTKPQTFTYDENQKKVEEKDTLRMKDASKTTLISSSISKTNPPVAIKAPEGASHQRRAAKKPRGKYSQAKNQDSDGNHVSSVLNDAKDKRIVRAHHKGNSFRPLPLILLIMLSFLSVVQALTDCQIMHGWLPDMFDGIGNACCEHSGISCNQGGWGRISQM